MYQDTTPGNNSKGLYNRRTKHSIKVCRVYYLYIFLRKGLFQKRTISEADTKKLETENSELSWSGSLLKYLQRPRLGQDQSWEPETQQSSHVGDSKPTT